MRDPFYPISPEPGQAYYRTDLRTLSLRESARFLRSPLKGLLVWLLLRPLLAPPKEAWLLPARIAQMEVDVADLSERCLSHLVPAVGALERLGFHAPIYEKLYGSYSALRLDDGGCEMLHESGDFVGAVVYNRTVAAPGRPPQDMVHVMVTAEFVGGGRLGLLNTGAFHDPPPGSRIYVHWMQDAPPELLFEVARDRLNFLTRLSPDYAPRKILSHLDLRRLADERNDEFLRVNRARGRLVPLTDAEVDELRAVPAGEF